tara:strand:- start:337 stop:795 length:459 start_codon:yes stop_codon:yes gene_type:complete
MKKIYCILIIFFFIPNCTLNKTITTHGVKSLDLKSIKLSINSSNQNDIIKLLGQPSTKSNFDENLWIYIEKSNGSTKLMGFGKKELLTNNVLILEINNKGMLKNKILFNKNNMTDLSFVKETTEMTLTQRSFIYTFFSSLRQKINDPLGKKK